MSVLTTEPRIIGHNLTPFSKYGKLLNMGRQMRDLNTDPLRSWHKLKLLSFWNSVTSKRRALHSRELTCMYWVANFFNLWKPTILASFLYPTWCMMKLNSKRPVWNVADNELISCKKICDWWKHNKLSLNMSLFFLFIESYFHMI